MVNRVEFRSFQTVSGSTGKRRVVDIEYLWGKVSNGFRTCSFTSNQEARATPLHPHLHTAGQEGVNFLLFFFDTSPTLQAISTFDSIHF